MYRRRIAFNAALLGAIAEAPAVAVNSFSYADPRQAEALYVALDAAPGLRILDPNPRPRLIVDLEAYRRGFERVVTRATLIKLSDEDARILYAREDEGLAASLIERGVEIVLFTRGKFGASVSTRSGFSVSVPATSLAAPIVDTMGAGDATLAGVIAFVLGRGMPDSNEAWGACLKQAMDLARRDMPQRRRRVDPADL